MTVDRFAVDALLAQQHLAVVGASDHPGNFGRTIVHELAARGYDVTAVHPTATSVDGRPCYRDLAEVPDPVDGVIVMVPAPHAAEVVREAAALGIRHVWLFKGVGHGSLDREAVIIARGAGMTVVEGACPMMYLSDVGWVHRLHRRLRHLPDPHTPVPVHARSTPVR